MPAGTAAQFKGFFFQIQYGTLMGAFGGESGEGHVHGFRNHIGQNAVPYPDFFESGRSVGTHFLFRHVKNADHK